MDPVYKDEITSDIHDQIIRWTENCDTKSSIILAFIGVILSILFTSEFILNTLTEQIHNIIIYYCNKIGDFSLRSTLMFVTLISFLILVFISCNFLIKSLKANINCSEDSLLFFGKIAQFTKEEYINKFRDTSEIDLKLDKLSQIYICAKICMNKFFYYNKSITYLKASIIIFIFFIIFLIVVKAYY
ncbi:MAG: hypothetical protein J1F67_09840 [Muribaculaceae bacterium]|nr:hypothetical protein [Muribaculaceae bacterium]